MHPVSFRYRSRTGAAPFPPVRTGGTNVPGAC